MTFCETWLNYFEFLVTGHRQEVNMIESILITAASNQHVKWKSAADLDMKKKMGKRKKTATSVKSMV